MFSQFPDFEIFQFHVHERKFIFLPTMDSTLKLMHSSSNYGVCLKIKAYINRLLNLRKKWNNHLITDYGICLKFEPCLPTTEFAWKLKHVIADYGFCVKNKTIFLETADFVSTLKHISPTAEIAWQFEHVLTDDWFWVKTKA